VAPRVDAGSVRSSPNGGLGSVKPPAVLPRSRIGLDSVERNPAQGAQGDAPAFVLDTHSGEVEPSIGAGA